MEFNAKPVQVDTSPLISMLDVKPMSFHEMSDYFEIHAAVVETRMFLGKKDTLGVYIPSGLTTLIENYNESGTLLEQFQTQAFYSNGYAYRQYTGLFLNVRAAAKFVEQYVVDDPQRLTMGIVRARAELTPEKGRGRVTIYLIIPNMAWLLPTNAREPMAKWYRQIVSFIGGIRTMYNQHDGMFVDVSKDIEKLAQTIADNGPYDEVVALFEKVQKAVAEFSPVTYYPKLTSLHD